MSPPQRVEKQPKLRGLLERRRVVGGPRLRCRTRGSGRRRRVRRPSGRQYLPGGRRHDNPPRLRQNERREAATRVPWRGDLNDGGGGRRQSKGPGERGLSLARGGDVKRRDEAAGSEKCAA